jgi:hypothetical protein
VRCSSIAAVTAITAITAIAAIAAITAITDELSRERLVPRRIPSSDHAVLSEVLFRCQAIVSRTSQRQVGRRVRSAFSERLDVMKL